MNYNPGLAVILLFSSVGSLASTDHRRLKNGRVFFACFRTVSEACGEQMMAGLGVSTLITCRLLVSFILVVSTKPISLAGGELTFVCPK